MAKSGGVWGYDSQRRALPLVSREARGAAKRPAMHGTASTTRIYPAPNAHSVMTEKPRCDRSAGLRRWPPVPLERSDPWSSVGSAVRQLLGRKFQGACCRGRSGRMSPGGIREASPLREAGPQKRRPRVCRRGTCGLTASVLFLPPVPSPSFLSPRCH